MNTRRLVLLLPLSWTLALASGTAVAQAAAALPPDVAARVAPLLALGAKFDIDATGVVRKLDLSRTRVVDADLPLVATLADLEQLDLRLTSVTDTGIAHLRPLGKLQVLNLFRTRLTDQGLAVVQAMPRLHTLLIGGTQVSDAGMARLAPLAELRKLSIFDTAVGDAAVPALVALPALAVLLLDKSRISAEGRQALLARNPKLSFAE